MKRTSNKTLSDLTDAPDLSRLVQDKRDQKRATPSKGRRRNRRYENRLLNSQVDAALDPNVEALEEEPSWENEADLEGEDPATPDLPNPA
jgi:hypothetical protein